MKWSDRALTGLLALTIGLAPLPLGSNRPVFEAILAGMAGLCLCLWGWQVLRNGQAVQLPWSWLKWPALCAGGTLLWIIVQLFPLPAPYGHPAWAETARLLKTPIASHLTVDVGAGLIGLIKVLTYLSFFALACQLGRNPRMAAAGLGLLAFSASLYAAYGLVNHAAGNTHILWLEKDSYLDSLTGTYVNRNAFAALCGMGLLACLSLLVRPPDAHPDQLLTRTGAATWLALAGAVTLCLALLLTGSRAGLVSFTLGLAVFWTGLWAGRLVERRTLLGITLLAGVILSGAFLVAGGQLANRLNGQELARDERMDTWRATIKMVQDAPLTGQGYNTFEQLLQTYRDEEVFMFYARAHNSYLEMAAEIGLPAALLWFAALVLIGLRLAKGIVTRRRHRIHPVFALAVLIQASAHALVDFSYQIPANAVWLAVILGAGTAQSFRTREQAG